jgi:hypothetical protein
MRKIIATILSVTLSTALAVSPLSAADPAKATRSRLLADVARCRQIQESAARLACFDASVAALDTAEKRKEVVVVDSDQVRQARKTLFGISVPDLGLFSGTPEVAFIDTTLVDARVDSEGHWTMRMADGARWIQTDDNVIGRVPRANDKVHIQRGALGSYKLSVGGQPAVKVRRVN